jgi:hypothetical protein
MRVIHDIQLLRAIAIGRVQCSVEDWHKSGGKANEHPPDGHDQTSSPDFKDKQRYL